MFQSKLPLNWLSRNVEMPDCGESPEAVVARRYRELARRQPRVEYRDRDGADVRRRNPERGREPRGRAVRVRELRRNYRKRQTVVERRAVALARALIRREEESLLANDRPADGSAELVARQYGAGASRGVEEVVVCVQSVVAKELVYVAVIARAARLRDRLDVAARVTPLRRVVEEVWTTNSCRLSVAGTAMFGVELVPTEFASTPLMRTLFEVVRWPFTEMMASPRPSSVLFDTVADVPGESVSNC